MSKCFHKQWMISRFSSMSHGFSTVDNTLLKMKSMQFYKAKQKARLRCQVCCPLLVGRGLLRPGDQERQVSCQCSFDRGKFPSVEEIPACCNAGCAGREKLFLDKGSFLLLKETKQSLWESRND